MARKGIGMKGFDNKWRDLPDCILGITKEIWEDRGIHTLHGYYGKTMAKRAPDGVVVGAANVISESLGAMAWAPGIEILGEDVIWSGNEDDGFLSSHRSVIFCPHVNDGPLGPPTGKRLWQYCIADCACMDNVIYDEWLVHDSAAYMRQLGIEPKAFAAAAIAREGGPDAARKPLTPETDVAAKYKGRGNDHPVGQRYGTILRRIMDADLAVIQSDYDRACHLQLPGGITEHGRKAADQFWLGLRASFPSAKFEIHHMIGREDVGFSPRAALRWSLTGSHDGWGAFGAPSGATVHVMGISHAEFGPWGLRREYVLIDEAAIWKQILIKTG
jgi:SnoaL-like domain